MGAVARRQAAFPAAAEATRAVKTKRRPLESREEMAFNKDRKPLKWAGYCMPGPFNGQTLYLFISSSYLHFNM